MWWCCVFDCLSPLWPCLTSCQKNTERVSCTILKETNSEVDAAIRLLQINITCSFNYLGNILRHGCMNPNLDFFLLYLQTVAGFHSSKVVVTCLKSRLPACPMFLFWKQDRMACLFTATRVPNQSVVPVFCFVFTQLSSHFFDDSSLRLHRVSILYDASVYLLMFFTAAGKVLHRLICCKKQQIFYSSNSEGWDRFPATTGSWK